MAAGADIQPVGGVPCRLPGSGLDLEQPQPQQQQQQQNAASKPPRPVFTATTITTCLTAGPVSSGTASMRQCTMRLAMSETAPPDELKAEFLPVVRSGGWTDIGRRQDMEDTHVRIDDLGPRFKGERPGAFYGVFDGHGGKYAAQFVRERLLDFILDDVSFPTSIEDAVRHAFSQTDKAFAEEWLIDNRLQSGTTALTALVLGRTLIVANAGDCRAVLSRRGRAVEMSRDHKPSLEKTRIEALGGFVDDGYLNGQLTVARALGDWHIKGLKELGVGGPLISEPELQSALLTEEDEFLIIGCDGLWDVFTSQNAVDVARRELQKHNDPEQCSKKLVNEALNRNTTDNLTVVTVCFHVDGPPRLGVGTMPVRRSFSAEGLRSLQDLLDKCSG